MPQLNPQMHLFLSAGSTVAALGYTELVLSRMVQSRCAGPVRHQYTRCCLRRSRLF